MTTDLSSVLEGAYERSLGTSQPIAVYRKDNHSPGGQIHPEYAHSIFQLAQNGDLTFICVFIEGQCHGTKTRAQDIALETMRALNTGKERRTKYCACCGANAGKWHQWHNQDTGHGLCGNCPAFIQDPKRREPMSDDELNWTYGLAGIHRPGPNDAPVDPIELPLTNDQREQLGLNPIPTTQEAQQ